MSLSVTKGEGVAVFTVTSDTGNSCPLICQLLRNLCCSPICFSSGRLRKLLAGILSSLGTVQMTVGLLTIGLGAILLSLYNGPYFMRDINAPYWLGGCFIFIGIFNILGERFPSPCMVTLSTILNLVSAILAIVAIVFYAADQGAVFSNYCVASDDRVDRLSYYDRYRQPRVNMTDVIKGAKDNNLKLCRMYQTVLQPISIGLKALLLATAVLQFCVSISMAVLSIKALKKMSKEKQVPEVQQQVHS